MQRVRIMGLRDKMSKKITTKKKAATKKKAVTKKATIKTNMLPATIGPAGLLAMAVEKDLPLEKLEKLMDLKDRHDKNEARKAFVVAMNAFKADPPKIIKDATVRYENNDGSMTEYTHASLGNIAMVVGGALSRYGLSNRWDIAQGDKGRITVTCVITHEFGGSISVPMEGSADQSGGKNNIQAVASTVTYLQRYTLLSAVGLAATDTDNDGQYGAPITSTTVDGETVLEGEVMPAGLPACPEDKYNTSFPGWEAKIKVGKSTAEKILKKMTLRYTFSADQISRLEGVKTDG